MTFLLIYTCFFIAFTFTCIIGWRLQFKKRPTNSITPFDPQQISVIIPFRNEAGQLPNLLQSLAALNVQPKEFIFVNDHSEDVFEHFFTDLHLSAPTHLLDLPTELEGKKSALRYGIQHAKGEYFLTWDADITVQPSYFEVLAQQPAASLSILPVAMHGSTCMTYLFELDYYYLPILSSSLAAFVPTFCAAGANLLVHKDRFIELDSFQSHRSIASGDDLFLLQDFKRAVESIQVINESTLVVYTQTPQRLAAFFQQRMRWLGKTSAVKDRMAVIIGLIGLFYHFGWIILSFMQPLYALPLFLFKCCLDALVYYPYLIMLRRTKIVFFLPILSLLYPLYIVCMAVLPMVQQTQWKGRNVKK